MGSTHAHGQAALSGPHRLRSVRLALAVALALFVAKLAVYLSTGLVVMLAEALHSLTDAMQTGFLLVAAHLSARPPDPEHPFGHGRGENLAAVMISTVVVAVVAVQLVQEAVGELQAPGAPPTQPELALAVLAGSALLMLWPLLLARRDMDREGGVVRAQAVESLNDLLGVVAAMAGIALVIAGFPQADALAALAVAAIIIFNAAQLFRANLPYLIGGSPPHDFYERVEASARKVRGALGVHSMAAEYVGPQAVHLDMSVTVRDDMTIEEADEVADRVRKRLRKEMGLEHVSIHFCSASGDLRKSHGKIVRQGRARGP